MAEKVFLTVAGLSGFLAVGLGAYGAHSVRDGEPVPLRTHAGDAGCPAGQSALAGGVADDRRDVALLRVMLSAQPDGPSLAGPRHALRRPVPHGRVARHGAVACTGTGATGGHTTILCYAVETGNVTMRPSDD
uniref:Uncharacterized protein LOC116945171 isoform X1 n=1 Tax=Petromyzon marinus TaxID=7757 RepID=A0AAJ7TCG7_PETMA|nr:uncharacterized protein LOC116945171 isoform X1 [Petromyzon marinus]